MLYFYITMLLTRKAISIVSWYLLALIIRGMRCIRILAEQNEQAKRNPNVKCSSEIAHVNEKYYMGNFRDNNFPISESHTLFHSRVKVLSIPIPVGIPRNPS